MPITWEWISSKLASQTSNGIALSTKYLGGDLYNLGGEIEPVNLLQCFTKSCHM